MKKSTKVIGYSDLMKRGLLKLSKLQRTKAREIIADHYKVNISRVLWIFGNSFVAMVRDGKMKEIRYNPMTESILSERAF